MSFSFSLSRHPKLLNQIFEILRRRIPNWNRSILSRFRHGHLLLTVKDAPFDEGVQARYVSDGTLEKCWRI